MARISVERQQQLSERTHFMVKVSSWLRVKSFVHSVASAHDSGPVGADLAALGSPRRDRQMPSATLLGNRRPSASTPSARCQSASGTTSPWPMPTCRAVSQSSPDSQMHRLRCVLVARRKLAHTSFRARRDVTCWRQSRTFFRRSAAGVRRLGIAINLRIVLANAVTREALTSVE